MVTIPITAPSTPNGYWKGVFTTSDNVAVHIVRSGAGKLVVEMSSINDGNYTTIKNEDMGKVCDFDLTANVFPKYWRIKSESEITSAVYTEGE